MDNYQGTDAEGFVFHTDDHEDALSGRRYTTRDEAIYREIVEPIESSGEVEDADAEYDVPAIAEVVLSDYSEGYACIVTDDEFWTVVSRYAR